MKTAICLLCIEPHQDHLDFFSGFRSFDYDVFVVADSKPQATFSSGDNDILRVDDSHCIARGYHHFNTTIKSKPLCSAWDKAMYFFADVYTQYDFVWLIEEDVFIPRHDTLAKIDDLYEGVDLIVSGGQLYTNRKDRDKSKWSKWGMTPKQLDRPPYVSAMCCATRMSRMAFLAIKDFMKEYHGSLPADIDWTNIEYIRSEFGFPFLEIAFPSIVLHKGLSLARPKAMVNTIRPSYKSLTEAIRGNSGVISLRPDFFDLRHIYHPVKRIEYHKQIREYLSGAP